MLHVSIRSKAAHPDACQHAVLNGAPNLRAGWIQQAGHAQPDQAGLYPLIVCWV